MEPPTTRRLSAAGAATTRTSFPSARMLEAQRTFQSVVKHELQLLLEGGTKREEAVKLLLRRIVASTEPPEAAAVRGVMRQFQMNYDDAVRALIVKQELGRLKRQGLDSFAAIEELTRKMRSREEEAEQVEREDVEQMAEEVEHTNSLVEEKEEGEQEEDKQEKDMPAAEMASPTSEKDGNETSSLSLIQRIGQVTISSGNPPEREIVDGKQQENEEDTDGEENESVVEGKKTVFKSPLRVLSPANSNLADLTPQSRKRRAAFGIHFDDDNISRSNSSGRSVKPLFPSLKKQKLCAEVGDGFLQVVTRKSKSTSSSLSKNTAASGTSGSSSPNSGKGGGSTRSDHNTKNLLKRQRASPTGMQDDEESPIAEELRVSHVHHRHHTLHHHSKRQKSSSTH